MRGVCRIQCAELYYDGVDGRKIGHAISVHRRGRRRVFYNIYYTYTVQVYLIHTDI